MDYIEVLVGVISALISSIVLIWWGMRICKKDITIKHNVNPYSWFMIHTIVYFITITLMLIVDMIQANSEVIKEMPVGIIGAMILFVQKGGLIILVMLVSSWIYNRYIKINEFSYFIIRYPWIKKIFFSLICISLGGLYLIEIQKRNNCNILSDDYSFIAVWIISFIQIWIGFGMRFYGRGEFKMRFSEWKKRMKSIEELKYFLICILSMLVIPIMTVVYYVVKGKIPESAINIIHFLFLGISFGAIVLILVIFFWNLRHNPNNCISKRRLNNCLNNLFNNKKIQVDYYEGVKYCIVKKSSCIALTASIDNVILDKDVQFDDEYRERLEQLLDLFEGEYTFEKYTEEDIRKNIEMDLSKFATDRKDILKEGWSKVYEVCEQKEKEK